MSKFGSNRSNNRGFGRNARRDDNREESRGSRYNNNRNSNKEDSSMRLGDISVSEKVAESIGDDLESLKDSRLSAYVKVYPPKGVEEIILKRGDYINIRLCRGKSKSERTIGFLTVSSDE